MAKRGGQLIRKQKGSCRGVSGEDSATRYYFRYKVPSMRIRGPSLGPEPSERIGQDQPGIDRQTEPIDTVNRTHFPL